jgi:hypothetical protein
MAPAPAAPAPDLVFRLVGTWWRIELDSPDAVAASTKEIARSILGSNDDTAPARARLRESLRDAATHAVEGQARLMLFQTDFGPGEPMSATLTLYERDDLRMSPALGTSPDAVLEVFERALPQLDPERAATAVRRPGGDAEVVRVHAVEETVAQDQGVDVVQRRLVAQYWYPQPGSKKLLLLVLHSPLGDIPQTLLSYFDAIVAASSFRTPASPAAQTTETVPGR